MFRKKNAKIRAEIREQVAAVDACLDQHAKLAERHAQICAGLTQAVREEIAESAEAEKSGQHGTVARGLRIVASGPIKSS